MIWYSMTRDVQETSPRGGNGACSSMAERVDRRTAAGWAGASSGGLPEREG